MFELHAHKMPDRYYSAMFNLEVTSYGKCIVIGPPEEKLILTKVMIYYEEIR